jgi:hypothetical protein
VIVFLGLLSNPMMVSMGALPHFYVYVKEAEAAHSFSYWFLVQFFVMLVL